MWCVNGLCVRVCVCGVFVRCVCDVCVRVI